MNKPENAHDSEAKDESAGRLDELYERATTLANLSLELQLKKDSNLDKVATQLMTAITILSVAYISPSEMLFAHYACEQSQTTGAQRVLAAAYIVILLLLFIAFVLVLFSRFLRKSEMLDPPKEIYEELAEQAEELKNQNVDNRTIAKYYCYSINPFYSTTETKNDRSWKMIKLAAAFLLASVSLAILFLLIAFAGYNS